MKKAMLIAAMMWMSYTCYGRTETVSGHSVPFSVDTRAGNVTIEDVRSGFCHGAYGMKGGKRATFLHGVEAEVEFEVSVQPNDFTVERVVANGRSFPGSRFTLDVGTLPVGGRLVVVAHGTVNGEDVRSDPFRANLDVASVPLPFGLGGLGVDLDLLDGSVKGYVKRDGWTAQFDTKKPTRVLEKVPLSWDFSPRLAFDANFSVENGTLDLTAGGPGWGAGAQRRLARQKGKFGKVANIDLDLAVDGLVSAYWEPMLTDWIVHRAGVRGTASAQGELVWRFYPWGIPMYSKGTMGGEMTASLTYGLGLGSAGLDSTTAWNLEFESDRFPTIGASVGVGEPKLAAGGAGLRVNGHIGGGIGPRSSNFRFGLSLEPFGEFLWLGRPVDLSWESDVLWLIDGEKAGRRMPVPLSSSGGNTPRLGILSRDYLAEQAVAKGGTPRAQAIPTYPTGGYPYPAPSVATADGELLVAYLRDDGTRADADRTEVVFGTGAESIWDDGTGDYQPSLGAAEDGTCILAWANAKSTLADDVDFETLCRAMEIAVAVRNPATGAWTARNLTADNAADIAPQVAVAPDGTAVVAWMRNVDGVPFGSAASPTSLMAARWNGSAWSVPKAAVADIGSVVSFDLAWNGTNAVLVYVFDEDGNFESTGDFKVSAVTLSGDAWGVPVVMAGGLADAGLPMPQLGVNGRPFAFWSEGGTLRERAANGVASATDADVRWDGVIPGDAHPVHGESGVLGLAWEDGGKPVVMGYDAKTGLWGGPVALEEGEPGRMVRSVSAVRGADGVWRAAWESVAVATNAKGEVVLGGTELRVASVAPWAANPGIAANGFAFATNEVVPGELTGVQVTLRNTGMVRAPSVRLRVWACDNALEEDEEARMELLGADGKAILKDLPGGAEVVETVWWMAEDTRTNLTFVARLELPEGAEDADTTDNEAVWRPGTALLKLEHARSEAVGSSLRLLTARLTNRGLAAAAAGTTVSFRLDAPDGTEVGRDVAGVVRPGEGHGYDAGMAWDMAGSAWTSAWTTVFAAIDTGDGEEDVCTAVPIRVMTPLDRDGDGLLDGEEEAMGTNPLAGDTDGDGVGDYEEVYVELTDPNDGDVVPETQRVTFNANGGICDTEARTYAGGIAYGELPMPIWEGYAWLGWFTEAEGGTQVTAASVVKGETELTLYAHWKALRQTVRFDANGGTCKKTSITAIVGETYVTLASASWENHSFLGWFDAREGGNRVKIGMEVTADAERTLYAHWKATQQTVHFDANGGTSKKASVTCLVGGTYSGFPACTWENHSFLGWFDAREGGTRVKNGMQVTAAGERTLYAHWKATQQTVHFDANGGTSKKESVTCLVGETYSGFPACTWENHVFQGWYDAPEGGTRVKNGMQVTADAERTLYAHWKQQTVHFDANGGTCKKASMKCFVGGTYTTLASATWDGRKFLGWFDGRTGGSRVKIGMAVTEDAERTLYAHWEQTVHFDANGGTAKKASVTCVIGETYTTLATATWAGHTFQGWYDAREGGTRVRIGMTVSTDRERTLYAHWKAKASGTGLVISDFTVGGTLPAEGARRAPVPGSLLTFEAEAGCVYELQWVSSLAGEWTTLHRWTAEADGEKCIEVPAIPGGSTGFYRLAVPSATAE